MIHGRSGLLVASHRHVTTLSHHIVFKQFALAEVEGSARQALLQDRHDGDEHLGADLRVEIEIVLKSELLDLLEGLLDEGLDLTLLKIPLLLCHWGHSV